MNDTKNTDRYTMKETMEVDAPQLCSVSRLQPAIKEAFRLVSRVKTVYMYRGGKLLMTIKNHPVHDGLFLVERPNDQPHTVADANHYFRKGLHIKDEQEAEELV